MPGSLFNDGSRYVQGIVPYGLRAQAFAFKMSQQEVAEALIAGTIGWSSEGFATVNLLQWQGREYSTLSQMLDTYQSFSRFGLGDEFISHSAFWGGIGATAMAGSNGFGYAVEFLKDIQKYSNANKLGLNFTSEISKAKGLVRGFKITGGVFALISIGQTYNDWVNGKITDKQAGRDAFFSGYSLVPVVGWAGSLQYYIIDNTIGFDNFMDIQNQNALERVDMINNGNWGMSIWRFGGCVR
jgi:hypothetical protein